MLGLYHSAYQRSSERLGKYQGCFQGISVTCWGLFSVLFRTWLAFVKKRKLNWRKCLSLFFQDAGGSSCHIWLILSSHYVASGKTLQAFSYPSLTRLWVPRSSSLLPHISVGLIKAVASPWSPFLSLQLVMAKNIPAEIANAVILYVVAFKKRKKRDLVLGLFFSGLSSHLLYFSLLRSATAPIPI